MPLPALAGSRLAADLVAHVPGDVTGGVDAERPGDEKTLHARNPTPWFGLQTIVVTAKREPSRKRVGRRIGHAAGVKIAVICDPGEPRARQGSWPRPWARGGWRRGSSSPAPRPLPARPLRLPTTSSRSRTQLGAGPADAVALIGQRRLRRLPASSSRRRPAFRRSGCPAPGAGDGDRQRRADRPSRRPCGGPGAGRGGRVDRADAAAQARRQRAARGRARRLPCAYNFRDEGRDRRPGIRRPAAGRRLRRGGPRRRGRRRRRRSGSSACAAPRATSRTSARSACARCAGRFTASDEYRALAGVRGRDHLRADAADRPPRARPLAT